MRYIVLRTLATNNAINIEALVSLTQKASGIVTDWVKFGEANINCIEPEKCDLLSFEAEEKDEMEENFQVWGFDETVAFIGVEPVKAEPSKNTESFSDNESKES